jgi:hypothetical protein
VREADTRFGLGEESSHWLCLRLMSVTARLVHRLLPEAILIHAWPTSEAYRPLAIVDCLPLIEEAEHRPDASRLPRSWDVTSDSIAAWLAAELDAAELVLLKSQLPPPEASCRLAAECSYVDRYFPAAAQRLPIVRCVNLRDKQLPEAMLTP